MSLKTHHEAAFIIANKFIVKTNKKKSHINIHVPIV